MAIPFTRWPKDLEDSYRSKGYWRDLPLSHIVSSRGDDESIAIVDQNRSLTYRELDKITDAFALGLSEKGLKLGDTALVQLGNTPELFITYFALLKLGVIPVNAIYSHRQLELEAYAAQIQPKLLVADKNHPLFKDNVFISRLKEVAPIQTVALINDSSVEMGFEKFLREGNFTPTPTLPGEVAFFNLSGGSTSTPKLIPRTHNDYYYSVIQSNVVCEFNAETVYLAGLPNAHNFAMSSPGALGVFLAGGKLVISPDPSSTSCFPLIAKHKVNSIALVPPEASLWVREIKESGNKHIFNSVKLVQIGGARLSPALAVEVIETFDCTLQQVFGMAEGLVNYTRLSDPLDKIINTQGFPMSSADEVWVSDADGNSLPRNTTGRLMTRGPYTFRGYFQSPEQNAKVFDSNGFYCSGDLISIDDDGYITVRGREKDQINRGGEKIAAEEIENLLVRHNDVIEAGIVSIPDDMMGEKSCAFVMSNKPLKNVELRRFLRAQGIAEFKLPDKFNISPDLPLTPIGKIDKKRLRDLLVKENEDK